MTYFVNSIYSNNCECHTLTTSNIVQKIQSSLLQQLLINQMLDRVCIKMIYFENDEMVTTILFDKNKEDIELEGE